MGGKSFTVLSVLPNSVVLAAGLVRRLVQMLVFQEGLPMAMALIDPESRLIGRSNIHWSRLLFFWPNFIRLFKDDSAFGQSPTVFISAAFSGLFGAILDSMVSQAWHKKTYIICYPAGLTGTKNRAIARLFKITLTAAAAVMSLSRTDPCKTDLWRT